MKQVKPKQWQIQQLLFIQMINMIDEYKIVSVFYVFYVMDARVFAQEEYHPRNSKAMLHQVFCI